ncbi:hypothetical protein POM88_043613 [Heracleum sosnowskyi]|uniref:Uncharacterized protein n=1 Tax=Heracleum sosnowskyi TaxID=360622 RepID=A0AAD8H2E4_9APIA|nr:hypothetical protein POM88_043613 [Heracleum sosnowskyi]
MCYLLSSTENVISFLDCDSGLVDEEEVAIEMFSCNKIILCIWKELYLHSLEDSGQVGSHKIQLSSTDNLQNNNSEAEAYAIAVLFDVITRFHDSGGVRFCFSSFNNSCEAKVRYSLFYKGWPTTGIPIAGCLGDQYAAMLRQASKKWEARCTNGTGMRLLSLLMDY